MVEQKPGTETAKGESWLYSGLAMILGSILLILFVWIKKFHSLTGLKEFLADCIALEAALLTIIGSANTLKATRRYGKFIRGLIVVTSFLCMVSVAIWSTKMVMDKDVVTCTEDPTIVRHLVKVMNDSSCVVTGQFNYLKAPDYDSTMAAVEACRRGIIDREMDRKHIPAPCKPIYFAAVDSIRGDSLARYCQRLEKLIHMAADASLLMLKNNKAGIPDFLAKYALSQETEVLTTGDGEPEYFCGIGAFLRWAIDRHLTVNLRPVYKGDRDHEPGQMETIEFLTEKTQGL